MKDFLDQIISERTKKNPNFHKLLKQKENNMNNKTKISTALDLTIEEMALVEKHRAAAKERVEEEEFLKKLDTPIKQGVMNQNIYLHDNLVDGLYIRNSDFITESQLQKALAKIAPYLKKAKTVFQKENSHGELYWVTDPKQDGSGGCEFFYHDELKKVVSDIKPYVPQTKTKKTSAKPIRSKKPIKKK